MRNLFEEPYIEILKLPVIDTITSSPPEQGVPDEEGTKEEDW